ncbi:MAG: hypothetical protein DYG89_49200 [Caldilinea sp. CFX5]|nr:hypothetical protein [Caldilinea sp. CFX5]
MHTSTRLSSADFQFFRHSPTGAAPIAFADFCPDYHELDRVGVVSPTLEAGVYQTSYALLALTTAFYDSLRARGGDFFDYPQHFAFVGAEGDSICTGNGPLPLTTPKLWDAWSWLDVWPANKWAPTPVTATGMLQRVFDYQINRLFWPRSLQPQANEAALPAYVWKMLRTRLKAVYSYGDYEETSVIPAGKWVELCVTPVGKAVVKESLELLPKGLDLTQPLPRIQCYESVCVEAFLSALHPGIK